MASFVCPISELSRFELSLVSSHDNGSVLLHPQLENGYLLENNRAAEGTSVNFHWRLQWPLRPQLSASKYTGGFIHVRYGKIDGKDNWRVFISPSLCEASPTTSTTSERRGQSFSVTTHHHYRAQGPCFIVAYISQHLFNSQCQTGLGGEPQTRREQITDESGSCTSKLSIRYFYFKHRSNFNGHGHTTRYPTGTKFSPRANLVYFTPTITYGHK